MTSVPSTEEFTVSREDLFLANDAGWLGRIITGLEKIADRMNPILVKETRQALKSRQFVITFLIVLIACWIASFMVVNIVGADVYYVAAGAEMLMVYGVILAFPLMLIVPFTAFRSLAAEQEDNTYDLLSITTLGTRQIVTGKLMSSMVQMLVYLSAVSPCIAFTFLLRGVDVLTVAMLISGLVLTSLALSMAALLAGTMAKVRHSQVLISVLLVAALIGVFLGSIELMYDFIRHNYSYIRDKEFWLVMAALMTAYVTTFALLHAAASAQIAFNSQNRSTPLRRIMLIQFACFIGWMSVFVIQMGWDSVNEVMLVTSMAAGGYWYVMGTFLTSEWPHLSRRVQRSLPQSQLGRVFLTWLNPGPGTGYMLCVSNITMLVLFGLLMLNFMPSRIGNFSATVIFYGLTIGWSYVVLFLGVGRLLISFARRFIFVSLTAGFLLHVILLLVGVFAPMILSFTKITGQVGNQYSLLHISNPFWTMVEILDRGIANFDPLAALLMVGPLALIVLLLNIRATAAEIHQYRRSLPTRLVEDEAELHPEPVAGPANPWEAEEPSS